jgi:putative colanic acid biosynthesis UDP-glucose lipid carrier transferase
MTAAIARTAIFPVVSHNNNMVKRSSTLDAGHEYSVVRVATGVLFGLVVAWVLAISVALHPRAQFDLFSMHATIAFLAAFVAFSNVNVVSAFRAGELFVSIVMRWLAVFFVVLASAYFSKSAEALSRVVMVSWLLATPLVLGLLILLLRWGVAHYYRTHAHRRKAVFVRLNGASISLAEQLRTSVLNGIEPMGYFDDAPAAGVPASFRRLGTLADVAAYVAAQGVDVVYIALDAVEHPAVERLLHTLQDSTASVMFVPNTTLFGVPGLQVTEMAGVPLLVAMETPFLGMALLAKRFMDLAISASSLVLLAPLMLALALAVKLSSPGPVLFKQKRFGVGGRDITVYKFRSMVVHDESQGVMQARQQDPRVTTIGRFLRRSSLDELPQLFNVLQGKMSIVGPRPHAVQHNQLYRRMIPGYMLRHKVKPGITGLAQVCGYRGETDSLEKMEKRIALDLDYIRHWSIMLDLRIMLRTIPVVLFGKNAY